jgi:hypothetical protein
MSDVTNTEITEADEAELTFEEQLEVAVQTLITGPVSPYRLASVLNELGTKNVKPQMMYNYVKNNLIPTRRNALGHIEVSAEDAQVFVVKFITRQSESNK